jgi:hypothetical protein
MEKGKGTRERGKGGRRPYDARVRDAARDGVR